MATLLLVLAVESTAIGESARAGGSDLRDVAARVARAWASRGGKVVERPSRFLMDDETTMIDLRLGTHAGPTDCRRVALIGSRGMSFHAVAVAGSDDDGFQVASAAGVIEIQGCGSVPDWVKLKSDSGRGALETVIATEEAPLPPVNTILLERTGGTLPSPPEPGALPPLAAPATRAKITQERLEREGFATLAEATSSAGDDGKGRRELVFDEGCHRLDLFAVQLQTRDIGRRVHLDLDGALHRADGDLLAEDQSVAPDVRLETCVAAPTNVLATYEGAPRGSSVIITHAYRPLPPHLPEVWGPDVRAHLAAVILEHDAQRGLPMHEAVLLARGAAGSTPVPADLEPGACYLAVAALERGHGRGHALSLHVTVGARRAEDEHGTKEDADVVAFCARDSNAGRFDVDARSSGAGWVLAVFRMVGGVWGPWR